MRSHIDRVTPRLVSFAALIGSLSVIGCGHEFPIAPARGVVKLNGQTVTGGRVILLPVGGGKYALGGIGPEGTFVLTSYREGDGAQVGENHVMVLDALGAGQDHARSYRAGTDHRVRVEADQENQFTINIVPGKGWHIIEDN